MHRSDINKLSDVGVHMDKETVVVIDPGHGGLEGGADDGAAYNGLTERFINMQTAKAMYEELSQYDNVRVYLTHDSADVQMSLRERAEFAKSVNADFLISIHYNASESHLFYGSEVWIPSIGSYYVEGYKLADAVLKEFYAMGLNNRGIKTRVGDDGDEYYGIIRESEKLGINAVIIEHCHIDNSNDREFFDSEEDFIQFGKADAAAAAKYLRLSGSTLSVDYSGYENVTVNEPEHRVYQDTTPPTQCNVTLTEKVKGDGNLEFTIEAADDESGIGYFSYSLDGGNNYSDLFVWNDSDNDGRINVIVDNVGRETAELVVRVYNPYNLQTESEVFTVSGIMKSLNKGADEERTDNSDNVSLVTKDTFYHEKIWYNNVYKYGISAALILSGICVTAVFVKMFRRNKTRKR